MAKPPKSHTDFARTVAATFDRLAFDLIATIRDKFDAPASEAILSRTRFALMDAVSRAEAETTPTATPDLFGPHRRRSRKAVDRGKELNLQEALTHAALIVRDAALREGYGNDAAWRAADLIVRGGAFSLHAAELAPSGPDECLRADMRCMTKFPYEPLTPDDIAAVHDHMAGLRARVLVARAAPKTPRVRSVATCRIEELRPS